MFLLTHLPDKYDRLNSFGPQNFNLPCWLTINRHVFLGDLGRQDPGGGAV